MNLGFSAEQESIRQDFRRLLVSAAPRAFLDRQSTAVTAHDEAVWSQLASLGWLATAIAGEHGGSGLDEIVLCVLAEEIGRAMAAVPFTASVCGFAVGLSIAGSNEARAQWLPRVADGSAIGVLLTSDCWSEAPELDRGSAGQLTVSGTASNVLDGGSATVALTCVGDGADARLILVDLADSTRAVPADRPLDLLHATASLEFDRTPVQLLVSGPVAHRSWDEIVNRYALFVAFEQLGGAEAALEMARRHSVSRYAFGRPIGAFQAVKHMLADVFVSIDLARSNCYYGAAALSMDPEVLREAAAVARISATEAFRQCARANIHVHGALGITWESDCQLYHRRSQVLAGSPGSPAFWKERLIESLRSRRAPARPAAL
jgi:alkylation response protein AidB-like acyl-CoA dehydrogenase